MTTILPAYEVVLPSGVTTDSPLLTSPAKVSESHLDVIVKLPRNVHQKFEANTGNIPEQRRIIVAVYCSEISNWVHLKNEPSAETFTNPFVPLGRVLRKIDPKADLESLAEKCVQGLGQPSPDQLVK